jgi:hypothetical protein
MALPEPFDGYVEKPARVSSTCLVAVARNRYSVPCELAGQVLSTRLYPGTVVMVADDAVVASHECVFRLIVTVDFGIVTARFGHRDRTSISVHRDRPFRDRDRPFRRS